MTARGGEASVEPDSVACAEASCPLVATPGGIVFDTTTGTLTQVIATQVQGRSLFIIARDATLELHTEAFAVARSLVVVGDE